MPNLERAMPFYVKRGPIGCLLIHGYTDCPFTLARLGERLAGAGLTVRCDLLPGHGTDPAELNRLHWRDWWEAVLRGYDALARECEAVFAMGLSFGGTLALHLATHRPLAGLVTLSAMLGSVDPRPYYARWLRHIMPMVPKSTGPDVCREEARTDYVGYDTVPVGGVAQAMNLIAHVAQDLPEVRCPILVIHGANDHTVPLDNAHQIMREVGSATKKLVVLPNSYHVITLDLDREALEAEVLEFVQAELAKRTGR